MFRRSEARDEEVREGSKKGKEVEHKDHPIRKERKREVVEAVNMVICMKC